jgi:hypothetical protein
MCSCPRETEETGFNYIPRCNITVNPPLYCNSSQDKCVKFPIENCWQAGGPCNEDFQGQWTAEGQGLPRCPDGNDSPKTCPDGYFCQRGYNSPYSDVGDLIVCTPEPEDCGRLGKPCCSGMVCKESKTTCRAGGGPYFDPYRSECIPNVECGTPGGVCCQPTGFRDSWSPAPVQVEEASEIPGREEYSGLVCNPGSYCVPDKPLEEQYEESSYLHGACVRNKEGCGTEVGAPCCIETNNGYAATGDFHNSTYCLFDYKMTMLECSCEERRCKVFIQENDLGNNSPSTCADR